MTSREAEDHIDAVFDGCFRWIDTLNDDTTCVYIEDFISFLGVCSEDLPARLVRRQVEYLVECLFGSHRFGHPLLFEMLKIFLSYIGDSPEIKCPIDSDGITQVPVHGEKPQRFDTFGDIYRKSIHAIMNLGLEERQTVVQALKILKDLRIDDVFLVQLRDTCTK